MLKRIGLAALLGLATLAGADPSPSHSKSFKPDPRGWRNQALISHMEPQKPVHVNTETAPIGDDILFGIPNEEMEELRIFEPIYTPKPGDRVAPVTLGTSPNMFEDNANNIASYDGPGQTSLTPPDPDSATGGGHTVTVINSKFAFYDKCGNQTYTNTFASFVGAPYNSYFMFDPKVIYDKYWGRWIMMIHVRRTSPQDSGLIMLISDDANPNGGWWYYVVGCNWTYSGGINTWGDYYDLGYGVNAIYAAGNQFDYSTPNANYKGTVMATLNKSQIYAAGSTSWSYDFPGNFALRIVDMYEYGGGVDGFMIASGSGGGSGLALYRMVDPFGSHTFTSNGIGTAGYSLAPRARQRNNADWYGFDCRLMDARLTYDYTRSKWHLYTSCNVNESGVMALRFFDVNPWALNLNWETNYWFGAGYHLAMPCPVPDYRGNVHFCFSYAGTSASGPDPSSAWAAFDDGVYQGNWGTATGLSPNPSFYDAGTNSWSGRWGDYAGGSLDWDDWFSNPSYTAPTKLWSYCEYMGTSGNYRTRLSASLGNGLTPGYLNVIGGNAGAYDAAGNVGTYSASWTLDQLGDVGVGYLVSTNVNWLSFTSGTSGNLYINDSATISVETNANANALPMGLNVGTIYFTNCYSGATITRTFTLSLGGWRCPIYSYVYQGTEFGNDYSAVCNFDGVLYQLLNDETSLVTELYWAWDGLPDVEGDLYCYPTMDVLRPGLSVAIYFWNSDSFYWETVYGGVAPTDMTTFYLGVGSAGRFISSGGYSYVDVATQPINDEDPSQDGWVTEFDWVNIWFYPYL